MITIQTGDEIMQNKFSKFVYDDKCTYKHAKGTGADPSREFHNYHEILLFVGGKTTFLSEEKRIPLSPYQTVIIPKETYHQFLNVTDEEYHRCVFSFYDVPELEELIQKCMSVPRVIDTGEEQRLWFQKMNETVDSDCPESEKQLIMRSLLALVLSGISREHKAVKEGSKPHEITTKCIELINIELCGSISIPELSRRLSVSVSTLTQTFKKDMNISVYQYILRKKLILARQKIQDGESATTAALLCGFNDYSSFYKQYKKMFGVVPSKKAPDFNKKTAH